MIAADGARTANEEELRESAVTFYEKLFNSDSYSSILPALIVKKKLTQEAAEWLIRPVSDKEVKKAKFQFNVGKAPGSDRYNAHFDQKH